MKAIASVIFLSFLSVQAISGETIIAGKVYDGYRSDECDVNGYQGYSIPYGVVVVDKVKCGIYPTAYVEKRTVEGQCKIYSSTRNFSLSGDCSNYTLKIL